ncbi:hypothetical protein A7J58_21155 [Enterobacter cloacae]|nr:hypothetical protein A7J56_21140 [Enterobacter cloacae]OAE71497.1 hypothetical protein A7J58_21155 [Enterobacter cloacae]
MCAPGLQSKDAVAQFCLHLFFIHVPPKIVQAYMGHERYESTEMYLKVFELDVAPLLGVTFSLDHHD